MYTYMYVHVSVIQLNARYNNNTCSLLSNKGVGGIKFYEGGNTMYTPYSTYISRVFNSLLSYPQQSLVRLHVLKA